MVLFLLQGSRFHVRGAPARPLAQRLRRRLGVQSTLTFSGLTYPSQCVMGMRTTGQGCLLADDMGLGKTIQSIALIWTLLSASLTSPSSRPPPALLPQLLSDALHALAEQNPYQGGPVGVVDRVMIVCPVTLIKVRSPSPARPLLLHPDTLLTSSYARRTGAPRSANGSGATSCASTSPTPSTRSAPSRGTRATTSSLSATTRCVHSKLSWTRSSTRC